MRVAIGTSRGYQSSPYHGYLSPTDRKLRLWHDIAKYALRILQSSARLSTSHVQGRTRGSIVASPDVLPPDSIAQ